MLILEPIAADENVSGDNINCQHFPASRRQCQYNGAERFFYGNIRISLPNIFFFFFSTSSWNLRNGKFWFIRLIHEIYAHTVYEEYMWIYASTFRLNWTGWTAMCSAVHVPGGDINWKPQITADEVEIISPSYQLFSEVKHACCWWFFHNSSMGNGASVVTKKIQPKDKSN